MKKAFEKKRPYTSTAALAAFIFAVLLLTIVPPTARTAQTTASSGGQGNRPLSLELRVDARSHARALCNGIQAIISMADSFEFYERSITSARKRVFTGPWGGNLKENYAGLYTLAGYDPASGVDYTVVFKQIAPDAIELNMMFKAPNRPSNLGFDIIKLPGDLFKGSTIEANPGVTTDIKRIPVEPLPIDKRMLLTNKNRVLVRSDLCEPEIKDLAESRTMLVADFRNIPWDKEKSIYFGAEAGSLSPGRQYSFRYSVRSLPPTGHSTLQQAKAVGSPVSAVSPWSFFSIPPKEEKKESGHYDVQAGAPIYGMPGGTAEAVLAKEMRNTTSISLNIKVADSAGAGKGIVIERVQDGKPSSLPREGFEIVVSSEKVIIRGADERGCLYGVYALLGRLTNVSGRWEIGCGTIRDWPDLPVRGICMELLPPAIRDVAIAKRYLDAFSRARSNVVVFLHNPSQVRAWMRSTDDGGWTKEQMAEIAQYARSLHMDVWGGMGSGFNSADFRELDIRNGTNLYNPFKAASYEYVFSLYDRILQAYHPSTFLISHDEIKGLSVYAAESGRSTADILTTDVKRIHDWLSQRKVRTAMWGDMLLDFDKWDSEVGAANSLNPAFNSGATHLALQQIPKDVLIFDWHYDERKSYGSIDYFRRNGFSAVGSPWYDPNAAKALAGSVKKYNGQGIIATDWGFLATLSPTATTLYAPLCGWSIKCSVDQSGIDVVAMAETVRDPIYSEGTLKSFKQTNINLAAVANRSTIEISGGNSNGVFGVGPALDLRVLSPGKQVLGGITFDLLSANGGQQQNCVVVANAEPKKDRLAGEKSVFKGNMQAQAIAFLHTGFVEEPQVMLRKMGKYIVEYANGTSTTVDLFENWNITDIRSTVGLRRNDWNFTRSPDVLIGAKPAWRGVSAAGIPLNVQVSVWINPYPEHRILGIRMSAATAPPNSQIALLGLTFLQ